MIHAVRGRTELPVSVRPPAIGPPTSVDPATAVRRERDDVPGDLGGETPQGTPAFSAQVSWHITALAPNRGCRIDTGGRTYCWGANADRQRGAPSDRVDHTAPLASAGW